MISRWNYDNTIKRDYSHLKIYLIFRITLYSQRFIYLGQAVLKGTFIALDEISTTIFLYTYWEITYWLLFKGGRIFAVICVFVSSTWSSKITVTKEKKERARRKKEKEEKKKRLRSWPKNKTKTSGTQLWKRKLTIVRVCKSSPKSGLYLTITINYLSVNSSYAWAWAVKSPGVGTIFRFN